MLNVDVAASAFVHAVPVTDYLREVTRYDCTKNANVLLTVKERRDFNKSIRGKGLKNK